MPYWWPALVFGWPPMTLSLALAVTGAALRKPVLALVSAALALPFSYYLAGAANPIALAGLAMPVVLVGSGYAVHLRVLRVAWSLIAALMVILILRSFSV